MSGPAKASTWLEALTWAEAAFFPSRPIWVRRAGEAAWNRVSTGAQLEARLSEAFAEGGCAELTTSLSASGAPHPARAALPSQRDAMRPV